MFKLISAAALAISAVKAEMKAGACPVRDQNKAADSFIKYNMAGLWYEYVWDKSFAAPYDYKCSTWIVLSDEADAGPGKYQIFNNMVKDIGTNDDDRDATFIRFSYEWDAEQDGSQKALGTYKRMNDDKVEGDVEVAESKI